MRSVSARLESRTEGQPGVFGVPLQTSIRYANVEISFRDDEGELYVYGYIPVLVAKTCVFLKEKGEFGFPMQLRYVITLMHVQPLELRTFSLLVARYVDFASCNLPSTDPNVTEKA